MDSKMDKVSLVNVQKSNDELPKKTSTIRVSMSNS